MRTFYNRKMGCQLFNSESGELCFTKYRLRSILEAWSQKIYPNN